MVVQGYVKRVRCLLDSGSQQSYILNKTILKLNLKSEGEKVMSHNLFDGSQSKNIKHSIYNICLQNVDGSFADNFHLFDQNKICQPIPRLNNLKYVHQLQSKGIYMSDFGDGSPEIEILLGADILAMITTGNTFRLDHGLLAVETMLGWSLIGRIQNFVQETCNTFCLENCISDFWSLDVLGIQDKIYDGTSEDDIEVIKMFEENISCNNDGRYVVNLPWKDNHILPNDNKAVAVKRLENMVKGVHKIGKLKEYNIVLDSWLKDGIVEEVPFDEYEKVAYYLPHRPVFKENSNTTKIRPVFDGCAKIRGGLAINDCLKKGPNMMKLIPNMLNKFRFNKIGISGDIKQAFLQIEIRDTDRDMLRFLWSENGNEFKIYRHKRLVFGLISSPFLLLATLDHHLSKAVNYKEVATKIKGCFYMDNLLLSANTQDELEKIVYESQKLLLDAKFQIREWIFGSKCDYTITNIISQFDKENIEFLLSEAPVKKVLGLHWDEVNDELFCGFKNFPSCSYYTKRKFYRLFKVFSILLALLLHL